MANAVDPSDATGSGGPADPESTLAAAGGGAS